MSNIGKFLITGMFAWVLLVTAQPVLATASVDTSNISTFHKGSEGDGVRNLQTLLSDIRHIYPEGLVTGYYGSLTEAAVKRLQGVFNLEQTGYIGPLTLQIFKNWDKNQAAVVQSISSGSTVLGTSTGMSQSTDLVAYWPFDEGSGTSAMDLSGNGITAKLINGVAWMSGNTNKAASFDGSNDYATAGPQPKLDNMSAVTLVAWINPKSLGESSRGRIAGKSGGTNFPTDGWSFFLSSQVRNGIKFSADFADSHLEVLSSADAIALNQWQQVAFTWDGSNKALGAKLYVNGVETPYSVTVDGVGIRASDSVNNLIIGNNPSLSRTFKGGIDEVRVYNRILSSAEIAALANGVTPPTVTTPPTPTPAPTSTSTVATSTTPTTTPTPVADTTAPTVPTGLQASAVSTSQINLSWSTSTDAVGVTGYRVYRGGTQIATVTGTTYSNTALTANTAYSFTIAAYDAAGNVSAQTASVSAQTQATVPTPIATTTTSTSYWTPPLVTSWQIQLSNAPADQSFDATMYDIDLYDNSTSLIASLHSKGRKVVCYFSAGSYENWRPDAASFTAAVKGKSNGWPGENWLDIRNLTVLKPIMDARMDLAKSKGCDGVDPDNVDGYTNNTGFPLTAADQLTYNKYLADAAHARGMSVGLKNDTDQVAQLVSSFDWQLNEQCFFYNECNTLAPFIAAGKPVFNIEYDLTTTQFCSQANALNFNSLKKNMALDAPRTACR